MSDENKTLVTVYGHSFRIGSDRADAGYTQEVAAYLDAKMRSAAEATGRRAPLELAIQAAMEIADEVLSSRQRKDTLLDAADRRVDSFARRLENCADLFGENTAIPPGD